MAFDVAAYSIVVAIAVCAGILAYLGIRVGDNKDTSPNEKSKRQSHFPLKLFLMLLAFLLVIADIGVATLITKSQCGFCAGTPYCPTGECTVQEQRVIDYTLYLIYSLTMCWLLMAGYFFILFVNWILHMFNMRKAKKAWLDNYGNEDSPDSPE